MIYLLLFSMTADVLLDRIDEVRFPEKYETYMEMHNHLGENRDITYKFRAISDRGEATYMEILEPPREAGRKFLLIESNIWMYAPEVGRAIRLSTRDKFLGSEFSNSDLLESTYDNNYEATSLDSSEDLYYLTLESETRDAPYKKIEMKVRKKNYIPSEMKFYTLSGRLFREMIVDSLETFEGRIHATYMKMTNVITPESYTEVRITSIETLESIPAYLFKPENLGR